MAAVVTLFLFACSSGEYTAYEAIGGIAFAFLILVAAMILVDRLLPHEPPSEEDEEEE